ncbi:iron ABC transporter substrate-binding protein [Chloroflexus sp.]|uniref:iron ABC transporter substrate-binding protein n=1 Tax=Chloroflexus sp. TaxID=1904827 RepID=UPI002ACEC02B|nr:iron ABC transporter substrate-binding protein [Chloroflexus sp.]
MNRFLRLCALLTLAAFTLAACGNQAASSPTQAPASTDAPAKIVVYSGRSESLVGPFFTQFTQATGIQVEVRYGDTAELAATILEEGANSPADLFFAQDAGALGALVAAGMLAPLPAETLNQVEPRFRSSDGLWVGISGRARVVVYNTNKLTEADLPRSITGFVDPQWRGRVGWAPTNGSFQAFVTAMRVQLGEEAARRWLEGMIANEVKTYEKNAAIVQAVAAGEIDVGFVNHYYLYQLQRQSGNTLAAANYYPGNGDVGALINIAGVGILKTAKNVPAAQRLIDYMLSTEGQRYFAEQTFEYPLAGNVQPDPRLKPLSEIQTTQIDLNQLRDLQGTLQLLRDVGAL